MFELHSGVYYNTHHKTATIESSIHEGAFQYIIILTTILPLSKLEVYLRVQKSLAGASVVGAYVCSNILKFTHRDE